MAVEAAIQLEDGRALLAAAAAGDRRAVGALFDLFADDVMTFARLFVREEAAARQLVTDTFVAAWRAAPQVLDRPVTPRSWLLSLARQAAADAPRGPAKVTGVR